MTYLLSNFECVNIEQVLKGVNKQPIAIGSFSWILDNNDPFICRCLWIADNNAVVDVRRRLLKASQLFSSL